MPKLLDANGNPINDDQSLESTGDKDNQTARNYAAAEEVLALKQNVGNLTETMQRIQGAMEILAARSVTQSTAPVQEVEEPELTDEELNAALREADEANPARKIRDVVERRTRKLEKRFEQEINQLRSTGLSSIAEVTASQASQALPHFKDFEKEIRETMSHMSPEQQANALNWRLAHDAIVGRHHDDIVKREVEAAIRQHRDSVGTASLPGTGGAVSATDSKGNKVPTVEDLGGKELRMALQELGTNEDEKARRMGYKSWADYMEKTAAITEGTRH